ncbi:hypothetical protein ACFQ12_07040 [Methylobacterium trifolii]
MTLNTPVVFCASDQLFDQTVAFLESARQNSPEIPLICIPYTNGIDKIDILSEIYDFQYYDTYDIRALQNISRIVYGAANDRLRKLACFTIEVDKFLFLDVNTIVLRDLRPWTDTPLDRVDLIFSEMSPGESYHDLHDGLIRRSKEFSTGCFLASRKTFPLEMIVHAVLAELFLYKRVAKLSNDDQPLLNFACDVAGKRTIDFDEAGTPLSTRTWYGFDYAETAEGLVDPATNKPVALLHFAGCGSVETIPPGPRRDLYRRYLADGHARIARERPAAKATVLDRFVPRLFSTSDD